MMIAAYIMRAVAAVFVLMAAIVLSTLAYEWQVLRSVERTFGSLKGEIRTGQMDGIRVGDTWLNADVAVRRNFKPAFTQWSEGCVGEAGWKLKGEAPILVGRSEVYYRDRSARNGSVSLCLTDGVVTSIGWRFAGPLFVDL